MSSSSDHEVTPLCQYAAKVLAQRLDRLFAHAEGARQGENPRHIHQMRVWSRRVRAAHDLFGLCFPGKEYQMLGREIKAVTDALGAARDLDVMIETLQQRGETLLPAERAGVTAFVEHLKAQRNSRQHDVERAVRRLERRHVQQRFACLFEKQGIAPEVSTPAPAVPAGRSRRRSAVPARTEGPG
jgi:CHAD domain-containing protein